MIEFLTHHGLASNWNVWERCLLLRKTGAQQHGVSLGQMERTASPGDANDGDLAVHVVQWENDGDIVGYARLYPRPIRGNFDASRPRMRLELERVCTERTSEDTDEMVRARLGRLIIAILGHARSHDYDLISGYGEIGGISALEDLGIAVSANGSGFDDGNRTLFRFDITADDANGNALSSPTIEIAGVRKSEPAGHGRPMVGSGKDVLQELEAMFDVDIKACRKSFESENLTLEAA